MTDTCYIIDTSSLIELNKHNPMDIYQTPWEKIEILIKNKRLIAPREVLNEINQYDDILAAWAKKHIDLFKEETMEQIKIVKEILSLLHF
jgi:hypothetical protein